MPAEEEESERLKSLARGLAEKAGLGEDEVKAVEIAASLLAVERLPVVDVLNKGGPLTPEDRARIRQVGGILADFAGQVEILRLLGVPRLLEAYLWRFDGVGNPGGVSGEAIPAGARALAVAYHYNGMVSDRAYRKAFPRTRALAEIVRMSGTVLDPRLVEIFSAMAEEGRRSRKAHGANGGAGGTSDRSRT